MPNAPRGTDYASLAAYSIVGLIAGLAVGVIVHEGAHIMIANRYGCDWEVEFPLRPGLWVAVYTDCPSETEQAAAQTNRVAEAVGYHVYLLSGVVGALAVPAAIAYGGD